MDFFEHGGRIGKNIRYDFSANINPLGLPEGVRRRSGKVCARR